MKSMRYQNDKKVYTYLSTFLLKIEIINNAGLECNLYKNYLFYHYSRFKICTKKWLKSKNPTIENLGYLKTKWIPYWFKWKNSPYIYIYGEIRNNYALFWVSKTLIFVFRDTLSKPTEFDFLYLQVNKNAPHFTHGSYFYATYNYCIPSKMVSLAFSTSTVPILGNFTPNVQSSSDGVFRFSSNFAHIFVMTKYELLPSFSP